MNTMKSKLCMIGVALSLGAMSSVAMADDHGISYTQHKQLNVHANKYKQHAVSDYKKYKANHHEMHEGRFDKKQNLRTKMRNNYKNFKQNQKQYRQNIRHDNQQKLRQMKERHHKMHEAYREGREHGMVHTMNRGVPERATR